MGDADGSRVGRAFVASGVDVGVAGRPDGVGEGDVPEFVVDVGPLAAGNPEGAGAVQDTTMTARASEWTNGGTVTPSGATL